VTVEDISYTESSAPRVSTNLSTNIWAANFIPEYGSREDFPSIPMQISVPLSLFEYGMQDSHSEFGSDSMAIGSQPFPAMPIGLECVWCFLFVILLGCWLSGCSMMEWEEYIARMTTEFNWQSIIQTRMRWRHCGNCIPAGVSVWIRAATIRSSCECIFYIQSKFSYCIIAICINAKLHTIFPKRSSFGVNYAKMGQSYIALDRPDQNWIVALDFADLAWLWPWFVHIYAWICIKHGRIFEHVSVFKHEMFLNASRNLQQVEILCPRWS